MTSITKRFLSFLLCVVMVVGLLPLSSQAVAATATTSTSTVIPADAEWKVIGGPGTTESDTELFKQLKSAMRNGSGTKYIRLGEDIDYTQTSGYRPDIDNPFTNPWEPIYVSGNVIFDLNGYRLDVTYSVSDAQGSMECNLFEVGPFVANTKMTVVDSRGKGEIHTNGYIRDYEKTSWYNICHVFNIFKVYSGTELVIDASGATFRCGRSKKQWVTWNPYDGTDSSDYTGYAYNQICGSVVVLYSNTDLTVAGGTLQARGYKKIGMYYAGPPCAAIDSYGNANINIIDGTFYGKGCASALSLTKDTNVTIRSGVFDVFKLDKIVGGEVPTYIAINEKHNVQIEDGTYGEIGIPDSALDPDNSDIIIGGHNYSEDEDKDNAADDTHKTVTIKPKTKTKTPDEQISVESANGVLTVGRYDSSYIIKAKSNKTYFSESDSAHLDNDLQDDTSHYYIWTFSLYDAETGKKCEAEPMQLRIRDADKVLLIDVLNFKQPNTNSSLSYRFESDHIDNYKIKAEVEEVWEGQHTYGSKFFNWFEFNYYNGKIRFDRDEAADALDFTVIPKENPYSVCNWYTIYTETDEGMEFYWSFLDAYSGYSADITCNSYYQYCTVDTAGKTVLSSKQEISTGTEYGDNIEFMIPPRHSGPVYVTVEYVLKGAGLTATVAKTHQVLALDYMYYDILSSDKVTNTRYVSPGNNKSYQRQQLSEGEEIVIKPNISADMTKMDVKDPITGKTIDKNEIKWQYSVGLDDYGKHIWNDVPDYEIVDYKVDGVKLPCVKTRRTAWYRIRYDWGGQSYYSPQYILVEGVSYEDTRVATVVRDDKFTGIYGKGTNKLYLDINKNADWYTGGCSITRIQISMIQKPSGASANTLKTLTGVTVDKNNRIELVNTDDFFKNEAGAVTGNYTFRVRVIGKNADGTTYQVTTNYDVWYSQQTTDLNLYVNGTEIYEHDAVNIPYILSADTNIFDFTADYYPLDSKGNGIDESSVKWTSSNNSVLRIDQSTGEATALTPGTVTVTCSWKDTDGYSHSSTAKVSVPIAGFEIGEIDYSPYVGRKLSDINTSNIATIKSLWSYGGNKITTNTYRYMTIELTSANGWGAGSGNFKNTTVSYNNNNTYGYTIKPYVYGGYFFAVEAEADDDEIEYYVDTGLLQTNGLDNGSIMPVEDYEATTEWNTPYRVSIDHKNKTYEALYSDYMYISLAHQPVIEDPNAVYLREVNITVSEPAVGDNRYEGTTYNPMNEYLVLNVSGLLGSRKADDSHSYVSKLNTSNMRGTGKPYDDASSEEKGALASEYMSVWNTNSDYSKWYKPTKTYENGIYVHDIGLGFESEGDDGLKIYLAKDAKVYVNGRMIDYADIYYSSYDESCVSFKYYFDVGEVETASTVKVTGIKTPLQGEIPSDVEDATVLVNGEANDSLYISKFIWFVDANGNGAYDEGEEAKAVFKENYFAGKTYNAYDSANSTLWYDGRFLAGVKYSLYTEFSKSDDIRIDTNAAISFDFDGTVKNVIGKTSNVFTFPADYVIRTVSIDAATTDYTEKMDNDPYSLSSAANFGGNIRWDYYSFKECNDKTASVSEFVGTKLVGVGYYDPPPAGKTWLEMQFFPYEGFSVSPNVKFLVNGSDTCEEFAPGRNKIEYHTIKAGATWGTINLYYVDYMFTSPGGGGASVGGTVTSFGSSTDNVTIQLIESGLSEPSYEAVVKGNSASYSLSNVVAGTYTLKVTKKNHATYVGTVTVGSGDITQNVKLSLYGDVNGDGNLTPSDVVLLRRYFANYDSSSGTSTITVSSGADVNGDGKLTPSDVVLLRRYFANYDSDTGNSTIVLGP